MLKKIFGLLLVATSASAVSLNTSRQAANDTRPADNDTRPADNDTRPAPKYTRPANDTRPPSTQSGWGISINGNPPTSYVYIFTDAEGVGDVETVS